MKLSKYSLHSTTDAAERQLEAWTANRPSFPLSSPRVELFRAPAAHCAATAATAGPGAPRARRRRPPSRCREPQTPCPSRETVVLQRVQRVSGDRSCDFARPLAIAPHYLWHCRLPRSRCGMNPGCALDICSRINRALKSAAARNTRGVRHEKSPPEEADGTARGYWRHTKLAPRPAAESTNLGIWIFSNYEELESLYESLSTTRPCRICFSCITC